MRFTIPNLKITIQFAVSEEKAITCCNRKRSVAPKVYCNKKSKMAIVYNACNLNHQEEDVEEQEIDENKKNTKREIETMMSNMNGLFIDLTTDEIYDIQDILEEDSHEDSIGDLRYSTSTTNDELSENVPSNISSNENNETDSDIAPGVSANNQSEDAVPTPRNKQQHEHSATFDHEMTTIQDTQGKCSFSILVFIFCSLSFQNYDSCLKIEAVSTSINKLNACASIESENSIPTTSENPQFNGNNELDPDIISIIPDYPPYPVPQTSKIEFNSSEDESTMFGQEMNATESNRGKSLFSIFFLSLVY